MPSVRPSVRPSVCPRIISSEPTERISTKLGMHDVHDPVMVLGQIRPKLSKPDFWEFSKLLNRPIYKYSSPVVGGVNLENNVYKPNSILTHQQLYTEWSVKSPTVSLVGKLYNFPHKKTKTKNFLFFFLPGPLSAGGVGGGGGGGGEGFGMQFWRGGEVTD